MTPSIERLWRIARKLRARNARGKALPPLLFFTDPVRTPHPERVLEHLPRGAALVYRVFGAPDAPVRGRPLRDLARRRGVLFMVGADVRLATALRADGVHWPERLAFRPGVNRGLARRFLLTGAAHGAGAVLRARRAGLSALVVSPVFPSRSPSAGRPLGARRLGGLSLISPVPIYALGGVTAATATGLASTRVVGLAAVESLLA
jgi:thiamine-phosphate pyrophosphorylase